MLLRRITEHVKAQNWTAVALDFVIVVVGVFIGIQVSNWNAARADNVRIERRLENLAEDLRADIIEVDYIANTAAWRSSAIVTVLNQSGNSMPSQYEMPGGAVIDVLPVPPFEAKLPITARSAITWMSTLDGNRGAYEALVNTGDLHLMDDIDLARKIQNYYARAVEFYDHDRGHQDVRDYVLVSMHRIGAGFFEGATQGELVELVRQDSQLAAELSTLQVYDDLQRRNMRDMSDEAAALIARIEE